MLAWQASAPARIGRALRSAAWTHPVATTACPNQSVLVVQVESQSHFVPTGLAEGESCPCRCGGIVDLSRNDKRECFGVDRHWMSVRRSMRSETVKSGCDGHGGDLREKWIHGAEPVPQDEGGGPSGSPVARLEAGAHEAGGVQAKE